MPVRGAEAENTISLEAQRSVLNQQKEQWEGAFQIIEDMFGKEESWAAQKALAVFQAEGHRKVLELGAGQGRDSLFFAKNGLSVTALDYSETAIKTIIAKASGMGLSSLINAVCHDIRQPFPYPDNYFDACYSHMLYCMALTKTELEFLSQEVLRVLKPNGLNIYTVRNQKDKHYRLGVHLGEDIYQVGDYGVHFFNQDMIKSLATGY
jgi:SAM-dependent methyltransferase